MSDRVPLPQIATLAATPDLYAAVLAVVDDEQMDWKRSPERWSIAEILGHLCDVERRNVGLRVRTIAAEDHPELIDYDQNLEYERGTYSGKTGSERLAEFRQVRSESIRFLRSLPPGAWGRRGRHPEVGEITIANLLNLWAFHDLSHLRQIAEIVKATSFWAGIGPLQHYYSVHP